MDAKFQWIEMKVFGRFKVSPEKTKKNQVAREELPVKTVEIIRAPT